jgi:tRNA A37 methylthiotransferase MiaB
MEKAVFQSTFAMVHATHPCTELVLDENQIRGYLGKAGWSEIPDVGRADLLVIATCAFNQDYEEDSVHAIEMIRKKAKPGAKIFVTGCFPKINKDRFNRLGDLEALSPQEMDRIECLVPSPVPFRDIEAHTIDLGQYETNRTFMLGITIKKLFRTLGLWNPPAWLDTVPMTDWYFVRGAVGCTGKCSYCAIRYARGSVKSTPLEQVVNQIREAVAQGFKEISLAGDDMGCYGLDLGTNLPTLLAEIVRLPGDFSLNLRFIEPLYLIKYFDRLLPIFSTGRITTFCAPIQSGSQRILRAMNKDYDIDSAVQAINGLLRGTKLRSISSNMMVGFPGETLDDWMKSYRLLETCDINMYQVLKYQDRPGTPSKDLPDKVAEEIKDKRRRHFVTKMQTRKFLGISERVAEKWTRLRHGPQV